MIEDDDDGYQDNGDGDDHLPAGQILAKIFIVRCYL